MKRKKNSKKLHGVIGLILIVVWLNLAIYIHQNGLVNAMPSPILRSLTPKIATLTGSPLVGIPLVGSPLDPLAAGSNWQLAGVTTGGASDLLNVSSTNLAIVNQDGTPNQINPPVNLFGERLQVTGDFQVTYKLSGVSADSQVSLYGTPPLIEDEFRAEIGTLDMEINGSAFTVTVRNQNSSNNVENLSATITASTNHLVVVSDIKGKLSFAVDNQTVGSQISDMNIFKTGNVWFGFDALASGSAFQVNQLSPQGLDGGTVTVVNTVPQITELPTGFAALAQKIRPGFLIGAAVAPGPMVADSTYDSILGNYNAVTAENVSKFQFIQPLPGNVPSDYNFADMDGVVDMALKAKMTVQGGPLVFGEANPAWVQSVAKNDPSALQNVMVNHITTVMEHYVGTVSSWDVIDEPLADYDTTPGLDGLRQNIWYNAMGPSYIALALKAAHAANPSAQLWINDFGMESDASRFAQMVTLIKILKAEGAPLTGIGFEAHIDSGDTNSSDTHINISALESRFQTLASMGLKARVSELDVSSESEYPVFGDVMTACLAESNCVGVTTWGVTNKYSSGGTLEPNGIFDSGIGLPWDDQEQPLPPVSYIDQAL